MVRDLGGERKLTDQLKGDVERLQAEHLDLKARLGRIEARVAPKKDPKVPKTSKTSKASKGSPGASGTPVAKAKKRAAATVRKT